MVEAPVIMHAKIHGPTIAVHRTAAARQRTAAASLVERGLGVLPAEFGAGGMGSRSRQQECGDHTNRAQENESNQHRMWSSQPDFAARAMIDRRPHQLQARR